MEIWRVIYFVVYLHKLYIYASNLKIEDCRFRSGKGAGPLFKWSTREALRKHWRSTKEAKRSMVSIFDET